MEKNNIIILIEKYTSNTISDAELVQLEIVLQKAENLKLFNEIAQDDYLLKTRESPSFNFKNQSRDHKNIPIEIKKKKTISIRKFYKYAALLLVLISVGIITKTLFKRPSTAPIIEVTTNFVELELEDGTKQLLTVSKKDTIRGTATRILGYVNDGKLKYTSNNSSKKIAYNTIKIPYGEKFQLVLSDGTTVHLNAGSSLRYPIAFSATEKREIFLKGEAFFDVEKDSSRPFIVNTQKLDIEVLGTRFNVSSYDDDTEVLTTLEEGAVQVTAIENTGAKIILKPNEQSIWNHEFKNLQKRTVDVAVYSSWKNGQLVFRSTNFKEISKKLQRAYDITIVNNNKKLDSEKFTARFDEENIEQIMNYFSKSYGFSYKVTNRTITIK